MADIPCRMIISDEQVRLAVEYLQTTKCGTGSGGCHPGQPLAPELMARVQSAMSSAPELRDDRMAHARALMAGSGPSGAEVAEKIIGRAISDSLR